MKKISYVLSLCGVFSFALMACSSGVTVPEDLIYELPTIEPLNVHTVLQQGLIDSSDPDKYVDQHYADIYYATEGAASISHTINWTANPVNGDKPKKYYFYLSDNESFTNPLVFETKQESLTLSNLKINTTYHYYINGYYSEEEQFKSSEGTFTTTGGIIRNIDVEGVENFRDLGGYSLENGKTIKQGLIYRSAQFNYTLDGDSRYDPVRSAPTKKGLETVRNILKIKSDIDVRKADEIDGITSSPLGSDVSFHHLPMTFGGTNVITNSANRESLLAFFELLKDESNYPMVFHCIQGKDRTGALAFVIGSLCGASEADLARDYVFTSFARIGSAVDGKNVPTLVKYDEISSKYNPDINKQAGETRSAKTKNYLMSIGVPETTLDAIIGILTE